MNFYQFFYCPFTTYEIHKQIDIEGDKEITTFSNKIVIRSIKI